MDDLFGTGFCQNQFDALVLDESVDALMKTSRNRTKKSQKKQDKTKKKLKGNADSQGKPGKSNEPIKKVKKRNKSKIEKPLAKKVEVVKGQQAVQKGPELRQITLDEYREEKAAAANLRPYTAPVFNLRQPGEGEDLSQWENLVPLPNKKIVEETVVVPDYSAWESPQRAERLRRLPMKIKFNESIGDRLKGRAQAEGGRVEAAPQLPQIQRPPKVNNEKEFPYLD